MSDLDTRQGGADLPRRFEPVQLRHRQIENGDVRHQMRRHLDRLAAGRGFAADLPFRLLFEELAQTATNHIVIVGDENAQRTTLSHGRTDRSVMDLIHERQTTAPALKLVLGGRSETTRTSR